MSELSVTHAGDTRTFRPEEVCTFGRSSRCSIRLDPSDHRIARVAGLFEFSGAHWLLRHHPDGSRSGPPLYLIDDRGHRELLDGGRSRLLDHDITVVVPGRMRDHLIDVALATVAPMPPVHIDVAEEPTIIGPGRQSFTPRQVFALAALFAEHLEKTPDPHALTYADAARLAGEDEAAFRRLIERTMEWLDKEGVSGMAGPYRREALQAYVIRQRVICRQDLEQLWSRLRTGDPDA